MSKYSLSGSQFAAMLRSRHTWCIVGAILLMALISFVYFYPDAAQGNVLRQYDTQQGVANGHEAQLYHEATGETTRWTNSLFSGMPTFQISPTYSSSGLFTWLDKVMGLGLPSPANLVMAMMLGFFILLLALGLRWYVALIGAIAYGFSSYFVILIGAGHIWKYVTLAYVPPTIAGVILAYKGRLTAGAAVAALFAMMQINANHAQMSYYFLFVIVALSIAYLIRDLRCRRGALPWLKATGVLAVAGALAVGANLPSLYYTYEYSHETMRGAHSELTVPAAGNSTTGGLDKDYITQYSYGLGESFSLLIPNVKGGATVKPEKGSVRQLALNDLDDVKDMVSRGELSAQEAQYLGYVNQYFGEPEGTNGPVYVGALIVALFLLGCMVVRGPVKWALVILTAFSILLALGRNCMWLTDLMIDHMPLYNKFRTVESILVIAEFTMPMLGMMGLQKVLTERNWKAYRRPLLWSFGIAGGLCLIGMIAPGFYGAAVTEQDYHIDNMIAQSLAANGADERTISYFSLSNPNIYRAIESAREGMVRADALRSLLFIAVGFVVLLLWLRKRLSLAVTSLAIGVAVLADLYSVNKRYLDSDSFLPKNITLGEPFPMTGADSRILADSAIYYRVMNLPQFYQPGPSYRHHAIGGYHAAKLTRYQDLIDRHLSHFMSNDADSADWNVLNMLNARWIVDYSGEAHYNPEAMGNAWFVDNIMYAEGARAEMDALRVIDPRTEAVADVAFRDVLGTSQPVDSTDRITLISYAPNELTYDVKSAAGGVAVFSDIYFPWGWQATIDGEQLPIGRVDYVLRAMRLPAGQYTLTMRFDPQSLHATEGVASASVVLIYLLCAAAIAVAMIARGTRKDPEQEC